MTTPNNQPTPPPGMEILTDYTQPLPEGAMYYLKQFWSLYVGWVPSELCGKLPPDKNTLYAIPITHPIETKTPEEWCKITGTIILDPDGWRFGARGFGDGSWSKPKSWEEPISLEEFRARTSVSTQMLKRPITHPVTGDAKPDPLGRKIDGKEALTRTLEKLDAKPVEQRRELLPCPFCGSSPHSYDVNGETPDGEGYGYWAVECPKCNGGEHGRFCGVHGEDKEDAETKWNTRK